MGKVSNILLDEEFKDQIEEQECMLKRRDFEIFTAGTAEEALELHRARKMDLIVVDLDMPEMGGDALCSKIKSDGKLRRVYLSLVCSGKKADLVRCERCGADSFLKRPPDLRQVTEKICRILDIIERRDKRVLLVCTVHGTYKDEPFFSASRDLSASGILFETDRTLAIGDDVEFSFILPDALRIEARGRVARVFTGDQYAYRCGVEFVELSPGSREAIVSFVEKAGEPIKGEEIF